MSIALASCATVTRGTKQGVKFSSTPEGATVTASRAKKERTQYTCVTPCELQLSRKRDFDVTFELEGYKTATGRLASRLGAKGGAAAVPGNFLAGGGIGFIVDAGTGATMQLKPDPMRATLVPLDSEGESTIEDVREEGSGPA
ncbi:MAG: translation initiation factor 2 [Pseudomonadota bacterium]